MLDAKQQTGENRRKYLRNANVQWDWLDLSELFEMDFNKKDRDIFKMKYGDLLICEGGEVGRSAIWRNELPECYFQKALHRVRPNPQKTTSEYLLHLMWFFSRNNGLKDHVSSATISHLTGIKLKDMIIPLPPIDLQKTCSQYYFKSKTLKEKLQILLTKSSNMFHAIRQRAFLGEL